MIRPGAKIKALTPAPNNGLNFRATPGSHSEPSEESWRVEGTKKAGLLLRPAPGFLATLEMAGSLSV